jgi:hypothetical protein
MDHTHSIAKALADNALGGNKTFEDVIDVMQVEAIVVGNNFRITVPEWDGAGQPDEGQVYEVSVRRIL